MLRTPGIFLSILGLVVVALACRGDSGAPGPSTPSVAATPVFVPADLTAFLVQFEGEFVVQLDCQFDQRTSLVDCGDRGLYQLPDEAPSENVICRTMVVRSEIRGLVCGTNGAVYYRIGSGP